MDNNTSNLYETNTIQHFDLFGDKTYNTRREISYLIWSLEKNNVADLNPDTLKLYKLFIESFPPNYVFSQLVDHMRFKLMTDVFFRQNVDVQNNGFLIKNKDYSYFTKLDFYARDSLKETFNTNKDWVIGRKDVPLEISIKVISDKNRTLGDVVLSPIEITYLKNKILTNQDGKPYQDITLSDIGHEERVKNLIFDTELKNIGLSEHLAKNVLFLDKVSSFFAGHYLLKNIMDIGHDNLNYERIGEKHVVYSNELFSFFQKARDIPSTTLDRIVRHSDKITSLDKAFVVDDLDSFKNNTLDDFRKIRIIATAISEEKGFSNTLFAQVFDGKAQPDNYSQKEFTKMIVPDLVKYPYTVDVMWRWGGDYEVIDGKIFPHFWFVISDHENKVITISGHGPAPFELKQQDMFFNSNLLKKVEQYVSDTYQHIIFYPKELFGNVDGKRFIDGDKDYILSAQGGFSVIRYVASRSQVEPLLDEIKNEVKNPQKYGVIEGPNCVTDGIKKLAKYHFIHESGFIYEMNKQPDYLPSWLKITNALMYGRNTFDLIDHKHIQSITAFEEKNGFYIPSRCIGFVMETGNNTKIKDSMLTINYECVKNYQTDAEYAQYGHARDSHKKERRFDRDFFDR